MGRQRGYRPGRRLVGCRGREQIGGWKTGLTGRAQRGTVSLHRPLKVRYVPRYHGRAKILGHILLWVMAMTRVAILIDGSFFIQRLPELTDRSIRFNPERTNAAIGRLVDGHLRRINGLTRADTARYYGGPPTADPYALLYRCFFYDAPPYNRRGHQPVSKRAIDYKNSDEAVFRRALFALLRRRPNFALRLGEVALHRQWIIREKAQNDLLAGRRAVADLTDDDFAPGFQQKAVDMRIGLDIASITLKKQADTIVLVTGDSDFVPAAKLARREGVRIILDPLWHYVAPDLHEHIDLLYCPFPRPGTQQSAEG